MVVTREPEWDDASREAMEALALYEAGVCSGCGIHHSLSSNLENVFTFQAETCNTCAGSDRYARIVGAADEKARKAHQDAPPASPLPSDGRKTYLRMMSPDEVAEARAKRASSPG